MPDGEPTLPEPSRIATSQDFGRELTLAKELTGLTVRQLAGMAAVPRGTVQGYLRGDHLPPSGYLEPFKRILVACGQGEPDRIANWLEALNRARRAPGRRHASSPSPYRGLTGFGEDDAEWFCGREELTRLVVGRLKQRVTLGGEPLVVVGPSGAGKSSLLRAGVLPALEDCGYAPVVFTPGAHPRRAYDIVASSAVPGKPTVLIVDQFEEVFAREVTDEERQWFINVLCQPRSDAAVVLGIRADFYPQALRHPLLAEAIQHDQAVVGPMNVEELRQAIEEPARRARLDVDEALIELVLRELVPRTSGAVSGAAHDPGALPLLSHALQSAWERHRGGRLTVGDYLAGGGIARSIAQSADAVYGALSDLQRETTRHLFRRLVRIGRDTADTRRRVSLSEILDGHTDAQVEDIKDILDRFTTARLLTVGTDTVEITHEALLRAWPQLLEWLDADRDWLRLHRRIGFAADEWRSAGRDPDALYRGGLLQLVLEWVDNPGYRSELNATESEFLNAGLQHQQDDDVRTRRRVKHRYQVVALLVVLVVVAASVAAFARQQQVENFRQQTQALSRAVANEADRLRGNDVALSIQLALAAYRISPTPEALSSLLDSTGVTPDTQLRPAGSAAESIAVSGHLLAAGTTNGTVQLWTTGQGRITPLGLPLAAAHGTVTSVAFSHDGYLLAAGGQDRRIRLWNVRDPARPRTLAVLGGPNSRIMSVALSSDGRRLAAGTGDGTVWLWNLVNPARIETGVTLHGPTRTVESVAFTPDGSTLAAGADDSTVRLWQVANAAHPTPLSVARMPIGNVFSVAISPDGRTLAAGSSEGHDVYLWNIAVPTRPQSLGAPLTGPTAWVNAVAFSPDGRTLAAGASDGQLWLFDLATDKAIRELPHPQPVTAVQFTADGTPVTVTVDDGVIHWWRTPGAVILGAKDSIFSVSFDGDGHRLGIGPGANDNTLSVWDPTDIHRPVRLGPFLLGDPGTGSFSGSGALSPDGNVFAVGDLDGTIQLWDTSHPAHPVRLGGPIPAATKLIEFVAFEQGGTLLAAASDDGTVHLFNTTAPRHPVALSTITTPGTGEIFQTLFSPDGRLLVAASSDNHAYLYNIADRARPVLLASLGGFSNAVYSAAFDSDGHLLAVGSADGTVRVWNLSRPGHPTASGQELSGPIGYIYSMAFAPGQDLLAISGNEDGTIWLWNLANPERPLHLATLNGPANGVFSVAFNPHDHTLAAGGVNHTVQLWNIDPTSAATWICSIAGQPITRAQWQQYVPGRTYTPPCS
ncbi:WD40 repeat protein [Streptomyces sp. 846.5]|nr:hypothetical protein [Streptomyces sp. 846.5]TDU03427.1 WD40 repeat protein [Streptomyces sp. 846.5]